MAPIRTTPRLSADVALLAACVAALPGIALGLRSWGELSTGGLLNPDSAMRLLRLRDIVQAGQPLHAVMRDGSGAGSVMSWSHLLDSLLLLLAAPFAPLLGWGSALHGAALAAAPLSMAALGVAVAWAALPVAARGWLWVGAVAAGSAPAIVSYGMLGVVHHHVWLTVAAIMAAGWSLRLLRGHAPLPGGIALGAWTAAGLWLSPEALPFALMATGALWVHWLHRPSRPVASALLAFGTAFAVLVTLAWLVDPPAAGYGAAEPDRISLPFVLLAAGTALTALTALLAPRRTRRTYVLVVGTGCAILWLGAFPQVLRGTEGLMSADQAAAFFGPINEMQPVHGLEGALTSLVGGAFALVALLAFAWRAHRPEAAGRASRPEALCLLYAACCAAVLLGFAVLHVRFGAYPASAGSIMLPIALGAIGRFALPGVLQSLGRVTCLTAIVGAPAFAPLAAAASSRETPAHACPLQGAIALLQAYPGQVVLAGVNETPDLLYRTGVLTVGSLYHRNPDGFMRLRAAWRSIPKDSPGATQTPELRATRATLVLGCPHEARSMLVQGLPEATLLDRLIADAPPSWLQRVADAGPGGYVLYAVIR